MPARRCRGPTSPSRCGTSTATATPTSSTSTSAGCGPRSTIRWRANSSTPGGGLGMYFAPKADQLRFDGLRPWSLAGRLTAWYAGSAFILLALASAVLYWSLTDSIARSNDQLLLNKLHVLNRVLLAPQLDEIRLRRLVDEGADGPEPIFARILSARGDVLMESPDMATDLPPAIFSAPQGGSDGARSTEFRAASGRPYWAISATSQVNGRQQEPVVLQVAADITADHAIIASYRQWLAVVLVFSFVVAALAGHQIARSGLRPLDDMTHIAGRIGTSTLNERISIPRLPAELRALAESFNNMMERLQDSFLQLRHLSDNIAHELRTPIQNIVNVAEIRLGKARSTDEYREHLEAIPDARGHLSRIVHSLLFLARAENASVEIDYEALDVRDELERIREFF